mmetsp:Transcript_104112/g.301180  ORF Transcript_104112/g.301180 Transcript_104112/m.301180 type:complete len:303 (-) Transcript_104112:498-1406(-)
MTSSSGSDDSSADRKPSKNAYSLPVSSRRKKSRRVGFNHDPISETAANRKQASLATGIKAKRLRDVAVEAPNKRPCGEAAPAISAHRAGTFGKVSHGCRSASVALGRSCGLIDKHRRTKSRPISEMEPHLSEGNEKAPVLILLRTFFSELLPNGISPDKRTYAMTPTLHMSQLKPHVPVAELTTSGARYPIVPAFWAIMPSPSRQNIAKPKSITLTTLLDLLSYKMFSSLRSRWQMCRECRYCKASSICDTASVASSSEYGPVSSSRSKSSRPRQCSMMRWHFPSSTFTSSNLQMFGWSRRR